MTKFLSIQEAGKHLGISPQTLRRWKKKKKIFPSHHNIFSDSFNFNAGVKCKVNELLDINLQGGYNWYWTASYAGNFNLAFQFNW